MPFESKVLTRDQLYADVWSRPTREIAKDLGLSDVALAKICKKLKVPKPEVGYWAKKAAGHEVSTPALPPVEPGQPSEYRANIYREPEISDAEAAFRMRPEFQVQKVELPFSIEVPATLDGSHPIVGSVRKSFKKAKPDSEGLVWVNGDGGLPVRVSPEQVDRALRFVDALFRGVEKAGHKVVPSTGGSVETHILIAGEKVSFTIRERLRRKEYVQPKGSEPRFWDPKWVHSPTGELRFRLEYEFGGGEWHDTGKTPIETRINDIFVRVLEVPATVKARRAERDAREKRWEEERQKAWRIEERKRREKQRVDELLMQSDRWHRAGVLRQYAAAVIDEAARQGVDTSVGSTASKWIDFAEKVASELDPISIQVGRLSLDHPEEEDGSDQ